MVRRLLFTVACLIAGSAHAGLDNYGVVIGTPTAHFLEPAASEGNWPHYVVDVSTPEGNYRAVINMFSRKDEQVLHREVAMYPFGDYKGVFSMTDGLHYLPFNTGAGSATGGALDFERHPALLKDIGTTPWNTWPPVVGGTTVPVFDNLFAGAKRVYIFGEPYYNNPSSKGIHDVHQNQGNMPGTSFAALNGRYQDGAMIIEYAPSKVWIPRTCGVIPPCWGGYYWYIPNRTLVNTRFQVQRDFTDSAGMGINPTVVNYSGSAAAGADATYGPFTVAQVQAELTTTSGNPDLYLQTGALPTDSSYRLLSKNAAGQTEFLRDNPGGVVYLRVKANGAASSWNLKLSYLAPAP